VRDVLGNKSGERIRVSGKGVCCYVSGNDTEAGRAANRRTEIELVMSAHSLAIGEAASAPTH
jgi:flagellar motor protein MotB